jgi:metallo-beta-lactamase class B
MFKYIHFLAFLLLLSPALKAADTAEWIGPNLRVQKLSANVYLIQSSFAANGKIDCNHMLIAEGKQVILVNTPVYDSLTARILDWAQQKFQQAVCMAIITHSHNDCAGGISELQRRKIPTIGLNKTNLLLQKEGKSLDETFFSEYKYILPSDTLYLFYPGAGHTVDNIVVWLPSVKILYGGCLVKNLTATNLGNTADADLTAWPATIQKLQKKFPNAEVIIPGHGDVGTGQLLSHTLDLLKP